MLLRKRRHTIDDWDAEDIDAWNSGGAKIALRNLIWSIIAEHIGFSVWSIWSVMVLFMPQNVYHIDASGKFFLVAMPALVGAILRLPYTFATATFGGRNWTMFSATALAVPTALTLYFMAHPATSYPTFMIVAAIAGLGGGNFASSMTNINAFYPQRLKGWALGLNAGGGNIGVAIVQIVALLVIATVGNRSPQWVCAVYLVALSLAAVGAALFMDNLTNQRTNARSMIDVMRYRDSWLIALLYVGTFGSFIGFSFAFGQVLHINFLANLSRGAKVTPAINAQAALHAAQIAFIGPLLGSIARPPGGWLSDRVGGSKVTLYSFAALIAAAGWLVMFGEMTDSAHRAPSGGMLAAYVFGFIALFILTGIGNGSVYKMIPSIFEAKARRMDALSRAEKAEWSRRMSGALIGIVAALCEEPTPAYDRVALSSYVGSWDRSALALAGNDYGDDDLVQLRVGERVTAIDRDARAVTTSAGEELGYDALVLATGSYPFVPPIPGKDLDRCFVYRTLDDLDAIRAAVETAMTRLRSALGAPRVIQTVVKRGYRLAIDPAECHPRGS